MSFRFPAPRPALVAAALLLASACSRSDEARHRTAATTGASNGAVAPATGAIPAGAMAVGGDTALLARADQGRIMGAESAPVWVIMISDFQCPYCKMWHDSTFPAIDREYVRPGKIRLAYVHLPLSNHRHAMPAAEATMCASAQGKFWPVHDGIFATQEQWSRLGDAAPTFEGIAQRAGVDMGAWRQCMTTHATRSIIEADAGRAEQAGIQSTPSFIIGGQLLAGAYPAEAFRPVIDSALAAAARGGRR